MSKQFTNSPATRDYFLAMPTLHITQFVIAIDPAALTFAQARSRLAIQGIVLERDERAGYSYYHVNNHGVTGYAHTLERALVDAPTLALLTV